MLRVGTQFRDAPASAESVTDLNFTMTQILLDEIINELSRILRFPGGFTSNPETASSMVELLIPIIMAMQTKTPLAECKQRLKDEVRELTRDVPKAQSQGARLCDEMLWPEYKSSFATLIARSNDICARLIKDWNSMSKRKLS